MRAERPQGTGRGSRPKSLTADEILIAAGFTDPAARRIAKAVGKAESDGFSDAVGDISGALLGPYSSQADAARDYAARQKAKQQVPVPYEHFMDSNGYWFTRNTKWGASIGWFQIRSLKNPEQFPAANGDRLRVASELRDPLQNAKVAYLISVGGTDFTKWTVFREETYEKFLDQDYQLKTGHARADDWDV